MTDGIRIRDERGNIRIENSSWVMRFHSQHTLNWGSDDNESKTVNIEGFDPNHWGVHIIYSSVGFAKNTPSMNISLSPGSITIYPPNGYSAQISFIVLQG